MELSARSGLRAVVVGLGVATLSTLALGLGAAHAAPPVGPNPTGPVNTVNTLPPPTTTTRPHLGTVPHGGLEQSPGDTSGSTPTTVVPTTVPTGNTPTTVATGGASGTSSKTGSAGNPTGTGPQAQTTLTTAVPTRVKAARASASKSSDDGGGSTLLVVLIVIVVLAGAGSGLFFFRRHRAA